MALYQAIVTGGATGIGKAICCAILNKGGKVHFFDFNSAIGQQTQKEFDKTYGKGKAKFVSCDVSNSEQLKEAIKESHKEFGNLNLLCNNAGICTGIPSGPEQEKMILTNLGGTIEACFAALDLMSTKNNGSGGNIINVASSCGLHLNPTVPAYAATKAGVIFFTRNLAPVALKGNVRVNAICPDATETYLFGKVSQEVQQIYSEQDIREYATQFVFKDAPAGIDFSDPQSFVQKPETVGENFMKLLEDKEKSGEVLVISKLLGTYYESFK